MSDDLFANHIPLLRPWLGEEEAAAVREVILSGWICLGPKARELEEKIATRVGAKQGVATASATAALHLALQGLGLKRDDEVILPSFTCMANANAVIVAGGVCRFADIERHAYTLDPEDVARRITARTRAIMMVDQIGMPADLDRIRDLAKQNGLQLVGDAATALGSLYKGKPVGGHGVVTCYSFHPRKMITTGEGGMLVTDDEELADRARRLRSTGASISDLVRHQAKGAFLQQYLESGYNYRLTDMQAAMGLVQLAKLDQMIEQRAAQAKLYDELLASVDEVSAPVVPEYATPAWSFTAFAWPGKRAPPLPKSSNEWPRGTCPAVKASSHSISSRTSRLRWQTSYCPRRRLPQEKRSSCQFFQASPNASSALS